MTFALDNMTATDNVKQLWKKSLKRTKTFFNLIIAQKRFMNSLYENIVRFVYLLLSRIVTECTHDKGDLGQRNLYWHFASFHGIHSLAEKKKIASVLIEILILEWKQEGLINGLEWPQRV